MAQGLGCKDLAVASDVSPETIRTCRKCIYRKLDVPGSANGSRHGPWRLRRLRCRCGR